ncbi:MAG: hypothetical protein F2842_05720 [Actinobacteria bacterium]|uniref:Unannotated protein n=1 Tax=freshwater metagenome TaxID=449393 RepID=A0A6J7JQ28_9ZZZZ|nr:hypothetical protein [Actinomycetota bacterium]
MIRIVARSSVLGAALVVITTLGLGTDMVGPASAGPAATTATTATSSAATPAATPAPPNVTHRAAAAHIKPAPLLKTVATGRKAAATVGVDAIAARNTSMSREALTTFLADPGSRVNPDGALYFSDSGLAPGIPDGATGEATPAVRPAGAAAIAPSAAFTLQSRQTSTKTIYLDFNGEVITNSGWNTNSGITTLTATPFDRDGDPTTFSDAERAQIIDTWAMVSEDYAPLDVNVTTQDLGDAAIDRTSVTDEKYGTRVVFTNSSAVQTATGCTGSCAGIAFLNGFDAYASATSLPHEYFQPAFAFTGYVGLWDFSTAILGVVAAHEAGHTLGLSHDGTVAGGSGSYYEGQGSWSPIMGSAGERPITQFSDGSYTNGNNTEDDYAVMATFGVLPIADDYPGTTTGAPLVNPVAAPVAGMVATAGDVDFLKFTSAGGATTITASPAAESPDLDLSLEIRNSVNTLVSVTGYSNPACATYAPAGQVISGTAGEGVSATGMGASVTATLTAGTYYAVVTSVGCGNATTGYSNYGSRGRYTVSVGSPVLDVSVMGTGSITSNIGGINCGATCKAAIAATSSAPTVVTLTATPGAGQALSRWSGPCEKSVGQYWNVLTPTYVPSCKVTMDQSRSVSAVFSPSTTLTVRAKGGLNASPMAAAVNNPPISCGEYNGTTFPLCSVPLGQGSNFVVNAFADPAQSTLVFKGWFGPCRVYNTVQCSVPMSSSRSIATLWGTSTSNVLAVTKSGLGTVTSNSGGINCGATCEATFEPATSVVLTSTPALGQSFKGWGGACSGTSTTCTLSMAAARTATAVFGSSTSGRLAVSTTGSGTVMSTPAGIDCGSSCFAALEPGTVALRAVPNDGSGFVGWTSGCSGSNPACSLTLSGTGASVVAQFTALPSLSSFSPTSGGGGTTVTLNGSNLSYVSNVQFNGVAAASFTIVSDAKITAVTPAGVASGVLTVTNPAGTVTVPGSFNRFTAAPTITGFSPALGPVGTTVTVTGTDFLTVTGITFNGVSAGRSVLSDTTLSTSVPLGATTGLIRVIGTGGTATSATSFVVGTVPTVSATSPTRGPAAGGSVVTLTGTGFINGATVRFGTNSATNVVVNSATSITATAPAGAAGIVNVTVTTAVGTSAAAAGNQFSYVAAPTVTFLSPTSGPAAGGTSVIITGTNFTGATTVNFGANAATNVVVNSATQITATAPAGVAGASTVAVTTPGGTSTNVVSFTYIAAPTVTLLSPISGPLAAGTVVTIAGTDFTGATAVNFGANPATNVVVNSATEITATTPAGVAGAASVTVTAPGGTSTNVVSFTYIAAPTVTALSPTRGRLTAGTVVTLKGTGFIGGATTVKFGANPATSVVVNSATSATATSPAGVAGAATVTVTTPGGTSTNVVSFTYIAAPTVTALSPTRGRLTAGTVVTLTGTGFIRGATTVKFGAKAGTAVTFVSATSIRATAPAGSAGAVKVSATTAGGTSANVTQYTYAAAPIITSYTPTAVAAGSTVTITGRNFTGATTVKFGTVLARRFTVISATSIIVGVPTGVTASKVSVTTPGGTTTSVTSYTLSGTARPTVTSFTPTRGPVGTTVTVTGINAGAATSVKVNGVTATFTVLTPATLRLTVPVRATTGRIAVTTAGGTAISATSFTVTRVAPLLRVPAGKMAALLRWE